MLFRSLVVLAGNRAKNLDDVERVETVFKDGVGYAPALRPHAHQLKDSGSIREPHYIFSEKRLQVI